MKKTFEILQYSFRFVFLTISVLLMEVLLKLWCFNTFSISELFYTALFTVPIALLISSVCSVFSKRVNKLIYGAILLVISAYFMSQVVYYTVFNSFLLLDKLFMATDVFTSYWREALAGLIESKIVVYAIYLPVITYVLACFLSYKREDINEFFTAAFAPVQKKSIAQLCLFIVLSHSIALNIVYTSTSGILSPFAIYTNAWTPELSIAHFGNLTTLRINIERYVSDSYESMQTSAIPQSQSTQQPSQENEQQEDAQHQNTQEKEQQEITYDANIMDIDFNQLIANETDENIIELHTYFNDKQPTLQNEYTGMFEGKNLIFITAEAFWKYAVNEEYTPTLYKLANEGFVFENFYNPLWWTSTSDGEFVATHGLYPLNYTQAFQEISNNLTPFTMGHMLNAQNYESTAYHNHTYTYYARDITHPNMGYEFYGLGNGLDVTPTWPESDLEMMELTIPQTLEGTTPFHNYYMTISGHLYYTFEGNAMSTKNKQEVEDLQMSEEAKAYLACQIELDKALEYLLEELEKAGELENTVICLSSDHHPYGLSKETMDEFYGGDIDENFEMYKSTLILYSADMQEPVIVDKACASVDILPTLLNLFGLEYDSRLLMGNDILSEEPALVVFSNKSFLTDEGQYNSLTDTWQANENSVQDENYALQIFAQTQEIANINEGIIMNDYYRYLFETDE